MIRITTDCPGLKNASPDGTEVSGIAAGSVLRLLREDDRDYFKVAFNSQPVYVLKKNGERIDSGEVVETAIKGWLKPEGEPAQEPPLSQEDAWQGFATAVGGHYTPSPPIPSNLVLAAAEHLLRYFIRGVRPPVVETPVRGWVVTVSTKTISSQSSSVTYTTAYAPYEAVRPFRFAVRGKTVFSHIGKIFGMQDIEVGHQEFDQDFIIQSDDEATVRALLRNSMIRSLLQAWNLALSSGGSALYVGLRGVVDDVERLTALHELFTETLNELRRLGAISQ